jgi:Mg-chelatase subunit ChlD
MVKISLSVDPDKTKVLSRLKTKPKTVGPEPRVGDKATHVGIVLDSSGSMGVLKAEVIGGYNRQAATIRENASKGGNTDVSLVTFGEDVGNVREKYRLQPVETLEDLTEHTYDPSGFTPMYDGIGTMLNIREPLDREGDVGFLVVILTDGLENASSEFTQSQIRERVKRLESTGRWTFAFIGANVDLDQVTQATGVAQTLAFEASRAGTREAFANMAYSHQAYFANRSMGVTSSENYWQRPDDTVAKEERTLKQLGVFGNVLPTGTSVKSTMEAPEKEQEEVY